MKATIDGKTNTAEIRIALSYENFKKIVGREPKDTGEFVLFVSNYRNTLHLTTLLPSFQKEVRDNLALDANNEKQVCPSCKVEWYGTGECQDCHDKRTIQYCSCGSPIDNDELEVCLECQREKDEQGKYS
jgi:hypothetical protein